MDKEKVLDRIAKLLALSDSPHEGEAKAALAKAHVLMMKHSIEEWELGKKTGKRTEYVTQVIYRHRVLTIRRQSIAGIIHRRYNVRVVFINNRREKEVVIFGTKDNVENAGYVFGFLSNAFQRLYLEYNRTHGYKRIHAIANAFFTGLARGFEDVLIENERRSRAEPMGNALMVIGKELQEAYRERFPNLNKSKTRRRKWADSVYDEGYQKGRTISINPGVGADQRPVLKP